MICIGRYKMRDNLRSAKMRNQLMHQDNQLGDRLTVGYTTATEDPRNSPITLYRSGRFTPVSDGYLYRDIVWTNERKQ